MLACLFAVFVQPCHAVEKERVFNVTAYGANGTDTVDDTAAIQLALDAAATAFNTADASNRSGVAVIFPTGTYKINGQLVMDATSFPSEGGGIMIRGEGRTGTIIQSASSTGALLIKVNVDGGDAIAGASLLCQIEDIQFLATAPGAGTAIEIRPYMADGGTLEENNLHVTPELRNVRIARTGTANYFTCGFKGNNLKLPVMDDVTIAGDTTYTEAGIHFENTYGHRIKDCTIDGANIGIWHHIGGEGNFFKRMNITNVKTGIKVENIPLHVLMSTSGGTILHSNISAGECGVSVTRKAFFYISDNIFSMLPGGNGTYTDVALTDCLQSFVTGNRFSTNATSSQTGLSLKKGDTGYSTSENIIVSDNTFPASGGTGVSVGSGVNRAMIFNNTLGMPAGLVDSGGNTRFVAGVPNPFLSPARLKDTETFSWAENMGTVYDVKNTYHAGGDGVTDDTAAIQSAASALATYINGGASRKAVLYFPAGSYKVTGNITMSLTNGAKMTIRGDGMQASVIEASGTTGLFNITSASQATRVDIHNLMIIANATGGGDGISVQQSAAPSADTARNLYIHNVLMDRKTNKKYFTNSVNGRNLARPFIENADIRMYKSDEIRVAGTTGVLMTDVRGFESDDLGVGIGLETGLKITSTGGDVLVKGGGGAGAAQGMMIDAGGGTVAIEAAHVNAKSNVSVVNSANTSWVSTQTLSNNNSELEAGQTALRLQNCQNVHIRNIAFSKSAPYFYNPESTAISLNGTANTGVDISGNIFQMPGKTYVDATECTTAPVLANNLFERTDVDDLVGTATLTRLYALNGRVGENYLVKNKASGKYLRVNPDNTTLACDSENMTDATQWKIAYDRATDRYTLESKQAAPLRLMRNGTALSCNGTDAAQARRWLIVKRTSGYYTLGGGIGSFVRTDGTTVAENGVAPIEDVELWQFIQTEDLAIGMDRVTANVSQTDGTTWHSVQFAKPYPQTPSIFVGGASCNELDPLAIRVCNVTPEGFDFQLDEWESANGIHDAEDVSFLAVSKGNYKVENMGTRSIEAGTVSGVNAGTWKTQTFNVPFNTVPCVFAQCTSINEASAVCARIRNVTATGFEVKLQEGKSADGIHADENVDFVAIDPGKNQYFEVGRTAAVGSDLIPQVFASSDWNAPGIVCSVQSCNENDPCAARFSNLTKTGVQLKVDEDNGGAGSSHIPEAMGWMVFGNAP